MGNSNKALLVVNFGGPRNLQEVPDFLEALLTDKDVIRTPLPGFVQDFIFKRIARKRSDKVAKDYGLIGGKSPIFEDTEWMASHLAEQIDCPFFTFHRYLRATHKSFIEQIMTLPQEEILVFPLFPQFSYATTGSIARFFEKKLPPSVCKKLKWVCSYFSHEKYIEAFALTIQNFLQEKGFLEEETILLFSAHGLPKSYIEQGDPYQRQCEASFQKLSEKFPKALSKLSYQSQFGKSAWITPSTLSMCQRPQEWVEDKKHIVFVPLSFTSDHIETLFEVEYEYVQPLRDLGYSAHRCPALGRSPFWVQAAKSILSEDWKCRNRCLIRR
ncbi:MAG: ferrochelatase [Rhabdochlamydiaceae bacterium]|nr:ferrochelatase [Rhabdochlamydiaceae bacterium]